MLMQLYRGVRENESKVGRYLPVVPIDITEVIEEVEDMHPYKQLGNRDSYSEYNEGWSDACDILGQAIKELLNR